VPTTLSAQVRNWTSGGAQVGVEDNEATSLVVILPAFGYENAGTLTGASVRVAGTVTSPLVISLASSDTTELQVPATVTIPQGSSSVNFSLTLPNDNEVDGAQTVTVTATAAPLEAGSAGMVIRDDDPAAYAIAPITSPKQAGIPFSITVTALDENGAKLTAFQGLVNLSAANVDGVMPSTPATTPNFTSGAWTGNLTIQRPGLQVAVTAPDSRGRTGTSNLFDLGTTPVLPVTLATNWLSYSHTMKRLFVTTTTGNLISIDPETAVQAQPVYLGTANAARRIEIAQGESHMFVAVDDGRKVRRLALPDLTQEPAFGLGVDSFGYANRVVDMVALPGTQDSVAISVSPSDNYSMSTSLYDSGVKRSVTFTQRITALEPSAIPGRLPPLCGPG
jgi:hypothetical protein